MLEKAYIYLRRFLGVLAIALGWIVLIVGRFGNNEPGWYYSISASAYTNAAPVFFGVMFTTGCFLITHGIASLKVYGIHDCIVNVAAGIFAWLIACFPCYQAGVELAGIIPVPMSISATIHNISAAAFFLLRAYNILFLFTRTSGNMTPEKRKRNKLYRVCAGVIIGFMALQVVTSTLALDGPYTMANEIGMLNSDGISWLVKGETLFRDKGAK